MSEKLDLFEITVKQGLERLDLPVPDNAWAEFEPLLSASEQQAKRLGGSFLGKFAAAGLVLLGSVFFINQSVNLADHGDAADHKGNVVISNSDGSQLDTRTGASQHINSEGLDEAATASHMHSEDAQTTIASDKSQTFAEVTNERKMPIERINESLQRAADKLESSNAESVSDTSRPRSTTRYVGENFNLGAPVYFTPDGDGQQDVFMPSSLDAEDSFTLKVRDLKGLVVFTSNDVDRPWTGTSTTGDILSEGRYKWEVILSADKKKEIFKGEVKLMR